MRSLDNYQRYIKQKEDAASEATNGEKNGAAAVPAPPAKTAPLKAADATRYVLRGGVTVPVSDADAPPFPIEEVVPSRTPEPKTVVPDAAGVPEDAPENLPASLWERLPRHIQLLAQIPAPLEEEVAQKYYTRDFRETRKQLIERLLDPPLTLEDTARVLGVCPATVRRYTNKGILLHQRTVGQQRRFRLSDVLLFLEQNQSKSARAKKTLK